MFVISPLEYRYKTEMSQIFDEEARLKKWLLVEAALARAHAEVGNIPKNVAEEIVRVAESGKVKPERVKEIEEQIHHDLMAMVKALSEQCSPKAAAYVHLGATSYDIEDTALALTLKDAIGLIEKRLRELEKVLIKLAKRHKKTVCIGRTHGQHAVPTTYGMKFALYLSEIRRHQKRIHEAKPRLFVGKMSGAVGTMATFGDKAFLIENKVMSQLGLKPALVSNQVIQRDRHAEAIFILSLIACTLEKIAKEIRNLQRTEIAEVAEPFGAKQVGSSTMPHKRNPHKSERICSLARIVRTNLHVALENIPLEHERDLTNSANERFILPEAFIITDYMLVQMTSILSGLEFFAENIRRNLMLTDEIFAERVMLALTKKGMGRQDAHEYVRTMIIRARNEKRKFSELLLEKFTKEEVEELTDPATYIGKAEEIVERALRGGE
ncbi:MAG: adenylosuccinate lyase [Candidatus Micrarchaeia archaeon]